MGLSFHCWRKKNDQGKWDHIMVPTGIQVSGLKIWSGVILHLLGEDSGTVYVAKENV